MVVRADDFDIDALLGDTFAKVGESPKVLQAILDIAVANEPKPLVDPRTLPVRFSRLKQFALSGAHYLHAAQNELVETLALRMGAGVHAGLFEDRPLVCYPAIRNGKDWEKFKKKHLDSRAVILIESEYATAMGIVNSVRRHKRAMELLFDGTTIEQTFEWKFGDRLCRSTPDSHVVGVRNTDLKSTRTAEPRAFTRDALKRHYHSQLAFYDQGLEVHTGHRPADSYLVAVENVPPFPVVVWRMPAETMDVGFKLCRLWWEQLLGCEASGYYPGYVESDLDLEIPTYEPHEPVTVEIDGALVTVD